MALWDDLNLDHPITVYDSSIGLEQSYYSDSFASTDFPTIEVMLYCLPYRRMNLCWKR